MKHGYFHILIAAGLVMMTARMSGSEQDSLRDALRKTHSVGTKAEILFQLSMDQLAADTVLMSQYLEELHSLASENESAPAFGYYHRGLGKKYLYYGEYRLAARQFDRSARQFLMANNGKEYAHSLVDHGNAHLYLADYEEALKKYREAEEVFESIDDRPGMARCLNNMGIIYKNFGDYDRAIDCYTGNVKIYSELNDQYSLSQTYINLGNVHVFIGNYVSAINYFTEAYEAAKSAGKKMEMALSLGNIGVIQNKTGNYLKAIEYYEKSLGLSREIRDRKQISNCLTNIGTNYIALQNYDLARKFVEEGLAIKRKLGDTRLISNSYNYLAEIHYFKGNVDSAIFLDRRAIALKRDIGDAEGLARCYNSLGRSYHKSGQYSRALAYVDSSLLHSLSIGAMEQIIGAYQLKKEIYHSTGNYREAFKYSELFKVYSDSLLNENKARAVNDIELQYQSRLLEQENERLVLQSQMDADTLERHRRNMYMVVTLILLLLVILVLVIYYQRRKSILNLALRKKNQMIMRQNIKLEHLNRLKNKILSIINHDLRGKIGNQVVALSLLGHDDFLDEAKRNQLFHKLGESATASLEMLENLVLWSRVQEQNLEFIPSALDLRELLEEVIEFFRNRIEQKEIGMDLHAAAPMPCNADRTMVTSILRNLIGNAIKYSKPKGIVKVLSERKNNGWQIAVVDKGVGMEKKMVDDLNKGVTGSLQRGTGNEKGAGIGLSLINELLKYHRGTLEIVSEKEKGSTFTIFLPCTQEITV